MWVINPAVGAAITFRQATSPVLYNKSNIERMETQHNKTASGSDGKCPKMTEFVPAATCLGDSNPILPQSSTPVGLPAGEKNDENRSRTFWVDRTRRSRRSGTNRKQFRLSGSSEVITNGATREKRKFPTFSFPGTTCPSGVVSELRRKKTKFQKTKVGCHGNVPWKFENRGPYRSSTVIAEL